MVVHSCHNFSAVTPCAVRSRQRLVAATSSHASVHGRQTARPTRRSRTVCFHSIEEAASPSENGEAASPTENGEEPTQHTQPIKNEDAAFGPRGIVLAGFNEEDSKKTTGWMQEMEADFKVSHVVDDMMAEPLGEALYNPDSQELRVEAWKQTRTLCPRICIMSGLTGEEQIAIAEAWEEYAGSPTPFFAAAVPNSLGESVKTILQAIVDENARNVEDDPRLDPSNFLSTVDMAKLRAQIQERFREKGVTAPGEKQTPSKGSDEAAADSSNGADPGSTKGKGFG